MQLWKVQRELDRIKTQMLGWLGELIEPIQRKRHDEWLAQFSTDTCSQPQTSRIAVFLLYQPAGISDSTLASCRFLSECGFSVFAVSNAVVSPLDRQRLAPVLWRLMERPNFGYDFGGYRDAIHWLWRQHIEFDQLLLVNDSIWFPVQESNRTHWLTELCDHPAPFCGVMELAGHRTEYRFKRRKPAFLGSFFLLFKQEALQSPGFRRFWKDYRMTSNKQKTIRRGERAISAEMVKEGFAPYALFRREMLDAYVLSANASSLLNVLSKLFAYDVKLKQKQNQLIESFRDSLDWVNEARSTIFAITNLQNLFVTAPMVCLETFQLPVIKKGLTYQNRVALLAIRQAVSDKRLALTAVVIEELTAATHFDP